MSWTGQVIHMFIKDVRAVRWLLLAYGAMLLLGVAEVALKSAVASSVLPLGAFSLRILAVLICALVVLADPPFNPRAHWVTLPYSRSAVLAAKCAIPGMLLLCTGLALAVSMYAFAVPFADAIPQLGVTLLRMLALLLAAAIAASIERKFLGVVVTLAIALAILLLLFTLADATFSSALGMEQVPSWVAIAAALAALIAVFRLFQTRRVDLKARIGITYAVAILVGLQFVSVGNALPVRTSVSGVTATAELIRVPAGKGPNDESVMLALRFNELQPSQRVEWKPSRVQLIANDGSVRNALTIPPAAPLNNPPLPLPSDLTWRGAFPQYDAGDASGDLSRTIRTPTSVILRSDSADSRGGVVAIIRDETFAHAADISVHGTVEVREPHVFGRLPLVAEARLTQAGSMFTVLSSSIQSHPEVRLQVVSMLSEARSDTDNYTFVIVNPRLRESVRLQWRERDHTDGSWVLAPSISNHVTGLLVPTYSSVMPAGWQQLGLPPVQLDDAWLQESELVIVEWVLTGTIPVAVRMPISAIASGPL